MPKINTSVITNKSITKEKLNDELQKKINNIGNLHYLLTNDKNTLVNAINELYNNTVNGKNLIKQAIEKMGVTFDGGESIPSYQTLHDKILEIKTHIGIASNYSVKLIEQKHLTDENGNDISYRGDFAESSSYLKYYSDQNSLMLFTHPDLYNFYYHHIDINSFKLLSLTDRVLSSKMIDIPATFETDFGTLKCRYKKHGSRIRTENITLYPSKGPSYKLMEPNDKLQIIGVVNGDTFIVTNGLYKYTYKIIPEY